MAVGNYDGPRTGPDWHILVTKEMTKPVGNTGPKKDKTNGDIIPLDGGLSILLAGAAIFGIKKLREKK